MTGNWVRRRRSLSTSSPFDPPRLMSRTTRSGCRSSNRRKALLASYAPIGSNPARLSANASRSISSRSSSTSRMRAAMSRRPTLSRRAVQGEPDARAAAHLAVDADAAAVCLDDALGDSQAEADARRVAVCAHAVEAFEQASLLLGRDAWPLVLDADAHHAAVRMHNHSDHRFFRTVLRGV